MCTYVYDLLCCTKRRMEEAEGERRRWVLKRGVRIGKQILVAGLLASSAPVVVPPLVVVSVIGISVSIPFGLFLASHACTHKLMSKLLPMPATPYVVQGQHRVEVCRKECVVKYAARGIEMGENEDDQRIGDGKKEDPQSSEHIMNSHKPTPSVATADETIGLHQESSSPVVNTVAAPNNNEVTVNEEKLLKEINAIRVIVGYEGTPQASCIDELKTLYILAGVEPSALLSASCNSYEIHDQLHFLMSILGVKSSGSGS